MKIMKTKLDRYNRPRVAAWMLTVALSLATFTYAGAKDDPHTSRYYANRAENYEQAQAWDAAKREIDDGLERYPDDPDLRYLNGRYYYYAQGDLTEARYNLVRAIQENDQHYQAKRVLVDVEDDSGHYSSAICYINELLEFQPYDRDLWRRKIGLYNKIGHKVEADAALERLARIYPNDSVVRRDLSNRNRENWSARLQRASLTESAETLEEWLELDPKNIDYYIELVDIYTRLGEYERAIGVANRGLVYFPSNPTLVRRAAGIMSEMGHYTRALTFVKRQRGAETLYRNLLHEVADDARLRDPYEANGRLYAATGDRDALTYLLNTSISHGYYDDARMYLQEAYTIYGRTPQLLMKEYALEKRFGSEDTTLRLLQELYKKSPEDDDLAQQYAEMMLELANRDIASGEWTDAWMHLQRALDIMDPDNEAWPATVSRQITVLGHLNRFEEARALYYRASTLDEFNSERFASAYADIAANRLRLLVDDERYEDALHEAQALLEMAPTSEAALRCCINMSQTLGYESLFHEYAERGYEQYPDVPYFIIKRAIALQEQGHTAEALALLEPHDDDNEYLNPQLRSAYAGISLEWATLLMKEKLPNLALKKIDAALRYDPDNRELLYMKGLALEQLKQFDEAFAYQNRNYNPTNAEQAEWYQHMRYLRFRSYRNRMDVTYTRAIYDTRMDDLASVGHLYSLATLSYSRLGKKNTITGQASYKALDGIFTGNQVSEGGIGVELMAQWDHTFNHRWSWSINGTYGTRFFNEWGANFTLSYAANRGWTPSLRLGYRRTPPTYIYLSNANEWQTEYGKFNLYLVTPSIEKSWERIKTSVSADLIWMRNNLYYNVGWKGKLFINDDNISSVGIMAGFGSFPELTFFEQTALNNVSQINAMAGFDAQFLLTYHLYIGLSGTWNTWYNPTRLEDGTVLSVTRNVYTISVQMHVAF